MLRVPLPFRGVAFLLLAASTAIAQTPEPPAELPLDPLSPRSPELLRQYSDDSRHPLLQFLVDGEFTSLEETPQQKSPQQKSPRLTPLPDGKDTAPSIASGSSASEDLAIEIDCPSAPCFLPYACPPPPPPMCHCRKCQRHHKHSQGCGYGSGYGNPYLSWPGGYPGCYGPPSCPYQGCCSRKSRHKQGCGYGGCGYPYGGYGGGYGGGGYAYGGYGGGGCCAMGCDGFLDGGCCGGCSPYIAPPPPPPPPPCFCHKCRKKYGCGQQGSGYPGYGSPWGGGYGGGYGGGCGMMGCGGFMDGCCGGGYAPPPPPPCPCRKCQRKHGCSYGYGYAGSGYPGWPAYPVPGANMWDNGYNGFTDPNCFGGCGKHQHCHGRCRHCRGHHTQPYPWYAYPPTMPCMMDAEPCFMDCGCGGDFCPALGTSGTCN